MPGSFSMRTWRLTMRFSLARVPSTCFGIAVAGRLAETVNGYQGQWSIGVLVDNLKGVGPLDGWRTWGDMGVPYSRDEYEQITTTSTNELALLEIERGWRDMKTTLDLRPV